MDYDDIIDMPHHVSRTHPPMPMADRAAQFAPFAALAGHDAAIAETARLTSDKTELTPEQQQVLSHRLAVALATRISVTVTFYEPDPHKEGGRYITANGRIAKIDTDDGLIILTGGRSVAMADILDIDSPDAYLD